YMQAAENDCWAAIGRLGIEKYRLSKKKKIYRITSYNVCCTKLLRCWEYGPYLYAKNYAC
ncbi:hypothetical protein, partial [Candidatus Paracaedibacter symbiosus]|uniref:hypothetical protein n=1 Tax=Candidatus Paracaedibacter symbiosus TaxID=244582 RepID=UPI001E608358